jgi:hypothetical protein
MAQRLSDFGASYIMDYFATKVKKISARGIAVDINGNSSVSYPYESDLTNATFTIIGDGSTFDISSTVDINITFDSAQYDYVQISGLVMYNSNNEEIFFADIVDQVLFNESGLLAVIQFKVTLNDVYTA